MDVDIDLLSLSYDPSIFSRNDTALSMGVQTFSIDKLGLDAMVYSYYDAIQQLLTKYEPYFGDPQTALMLENHTSIVGSNTTPFDATSLIGLNRSKILGDPTMGFIAHLDTYLIGPTVEEALVSFE